MILLKASVRDKKEKTAALRKQGFLPAVLYGEKVSSTPIKVLEKEFEKVFREAGESSLVSLEVGAKKYDVLIHQLARDPFSGVFWHVDFYQPSTKKEVEVEIPLLFKGESAAVNDMGGVLVKEIHEVKVKGLVHNLPREIEVDLAVLKKLGDRIYVKDLAVQKGLEILKHPEDIVVLVQVPKAQAAEEPAAPVAVEPEPIVQDESDNQN